ncbi:SUN domain-containing ossification factor-like isoform X1 [Oreochromis aureus]|uniref:SUN domain-containing ossification factor n=1 Tax=Oreochromis aureus TaxID=47969 RepID=A0A668RSJ5_OREAU|nr:SUN domain-containing ossification factor-like isoform X1 [Oreochromis aureus]
MKMTPLLWRLVSVWLAVVYCCYVGCTELQGEAQSPVSPKEVSSEEEPQEHSHHHEVEESLVVPAPPFPENEPPTEDDRVKEEQMPQEVGQKEYDMAFEADESAAEVELEADKGISQPEHSSESQHIEISVTQDQEHGSPPPSPDSVAAFSAETNDSPNKDSIPKGVPGDALDVAASEVNDSDLPPAECEEENNPYENDSSPPVVLENTSNAHTAGTKVHTDVPLSSPAGHGTQHLESNVSHTLKEADLSSPGTTDTDSSVSAKDPEDIPTFDEWKRKMMEVEKEKTQSTHTSNNVGSHTVKKVQKNFNNYASVECGAKILGANPEAKSTSAILKENMDLYMLNPCSNKIWFIIELCEPIQVKQLDIANFELFSSTPKDFLVSISDRYPTNKWLKLGTFHARDERTVQSFPLDEHLYAKYVKMFTKYIKVELVSHFGSEHFCPLSLIRVFGTSMVEEYEEIADPSERPDDQDDDLDYPSGSAPGEAKLSKNLIGSAKDAILNMVNNIAVNVLGGGTEMNGSLSSQEVNITEPSQPLESTTETTITTTSVPDSEDVQISQDTDIPETVENSTLETSTTSDGVKQELPPVEEKIVLPLDKDEEEPISSTIILLDKEDDLEEEKKDHHERQQESLKYCPPVPSLSSPCSCAASLLEYFQQQCSASLSKHRECQTVEKQQIIPSTQTPSWHPPTHSSAPPEPQQHPSELHQLQDKEQASEQEPESEAVESEVSQPPGNTEESVSGSPLLEPSQTMKLPKPSDPDSFAAKPTHIVETPQLSTLEPAKEPGPENSQDVLEEEEHIEPSASLSSSVPVKPSTSVTADDISVTPPEETLEIDVTQVETNVLIQTQDKTDQSPVPAPTGSPHLEQQPDSAVVPESSTASSEVSPPAPEPATEPEPSGGHAAIADAKMEDFADDISTSSSGNGQLPRPSSPTPSSPTSPSLSDIYADPPNGTEQNGNPVHSSSQKESVFMRLNNRIKALEMNMSLSGRYLEQLSQRYRKQMEEMQKAFNKTIIKLQNTSRIAEEQDQRQTESIQFLQGQLENVTQLVLNLSVRVSQLQNEVSDRQNYLLLSLILCLCLGLLLCANHCRLSTVPPTTEPEPPSPKSYTYCCPESRQFSCCDELGLKRSASYPLINSYSFQLATTEGPEMLHAEGTESLYPANRKRRRRKMKLLEKVETLKPSLHSSPELTNGVCNGAPVTTNPIPLTKNLLHPTFRDSPSEGSSEGSSHSDDPSFCGLTTACSRICDGLPPPKSRAEKRAWRRRRPKPSCAVVDFLHAPRRDKSEPLPISTIEDILRRKTEPSTKTFVALSGPV